MMPPFQARVAGFVAAHHLASDAQSRILDLMSEAGELAKEMLKGTNYGSGAFEANDAWRDELGDVFFSLICLANQTDVDLEQALAGALVKYESRLTRYSSAGSER